MDKRKLEQFKKMIRFLVVALLIVATTLAFIWFWKENYNEGIVLLFWKSQVQMNYIPVNSTSGNRGTLQDKKFYKRSKHPV